MPNFDLDRRLVAAVLALLVLVAALAGIYLWGRHAGVAAEEKRTAPVLKKLNDDLGACHTNVDRLTESLEQQNAAVDALREEGEERTRRADAAIRAAQRQAADYKAKADRLARARPGPDMCASARYLIIDSLSEDRR